MELLFQFHILTTLVSCIKVYGQVVQPFKHPGLKVLATASHYWPLDAVEGIHELWDQIGNRPGHINGTNITLRIHNHTVLPSSHNSSYVYSNDSAYTNISATVDIVEGMVNKGIFLNGDNGGTFLHFGSYQNSCISDPMLCGPEGITFSFFWKNHEAQSRFAIASGGKVISNGFSVYANPFGGYVEFYTRGNNQRWKVDISIPGPFWTHVLFTWTLKDGLKVYINGSFIIGDPAGIVSDNYGDPYPDLVIGTGNEKNYGHYVTGAFDEFIIWERALSPHDILLYYNAATGSRTSPPPPPPPWCWLRGNICPYPRHIAATAGTTEVSLVVVSSPGEQNPDSQTTVDVPILSFLEALPGNLPNKTLPQDSANNLTQAFLRSVEEVLSFSSCARGKLNITTQHSDQHSSVVVSGLIETVDRVMEHMVTNLQHSSQSLLSLGGTSFIAVVRKLNELYKACVMYCRSLNDRLQNFLLNKQRLMDRFNGIAAEKLIYNHAVHMVQSAALDEMFHCSTASIQQYHKGLLLMEGLSRFVTETCDAESVFALLFFRLAQRQMNTRLWTHKSTLMSRTQGKRPLKLQLVYYRPA
ncbi:unnamed protein product [Merluccius merluccius]